jgi:hypothetical protein
MTLGTNFPPATSTTSSQARRVSSLAMALEDDSNAKPARLSRSRLSRQVSNEALSTSDCDNENLARKKAPSTGRASPIRCVSEFDKVVAAAAPASGHVETSIANVAPPFPNPLLDAKMFAQHKLALRLESELQPMRLILSRIMAHPTYNRKGIFNAPVDPVALGLADYFTVISNPMDFGTIKARLHALAYKSCGAVVSDIRLVLENAMKYNPPHNTVYVSARQLSSFFEEQLRAFVPDVLRLDGIGELKVPPPSDVAHVDVEESSTTDTVIQGTESSMSLVAPHVYTLATRMTAVPEELAPPKMIMSRKRRKRGIRLNSGHDCEMCEGRTCSICNQGCLHLEPTLLICSGPHCAGAKIRKNSTYFIAPDGSRQYCERCHAGLPSILPGAGDDDAWRYKLKLLRRKNDEEIVERWVTCVRCQQGVHSVCALHNEYAANAEFVCLECFHLSDTVLLRKSARTLSQDVYSFISGADLPVCMSEISESNFRLGEHVVSAEALPETNESAYIQSKVRERMASESYPHSDKTVSVRVISDCSRFFKVPDVIRRHFQMPSKDCKQAVAPPTQVNYSSKAIALFQKIDGLDVCMFCMYVQEYAGSDEYEEPADKEFAQPTKRVYIAYLDSVEHFRPRACRTEVYQELLVSYLATARKRGYETAHIWACPPSRGNSFVFWNHPASQRTPNMERLVTWYHGALSRAISCGVVVEVKSLYETSFQGHLESLCKDASKLEGQMECPPLLDGDFWIEEAVRIHSINFSRYLKVKPEPYGALRSDAEARQYYPAIEVASMVLDRLIAHPSSLPFRRPVNAAALKLVDYHSVILKPIDLGTVHSRIVLGEYRVLRDVVSDMELVFANAKLYNPKGHVVHERAVELCDVFFAELNRLVLTWTDLLTGTLTDPPWKSFLDVSMSLDLMRPLSETKAMGRRLPALSAVCKAEKDTGVGRPCLPTELLQGVDAIQRKMVGSDTWMLEKRSSVSWKEQASGIAKKACRRKKGDSRGGGEELLPTRRHQRWLAEAVGASVRRNRMSFFHCSLQPSKSHPDAEKAAQFSEYAASFRLNDHAVYQPTQVADARHALLEFAQFRNLEFDTLRRAKYSSAILLYHLHHDDAPGMIPVCSTCNHHIDAVRWHRVSRVNMRWRPRKRPSLVGKQTHALLPYTPKELCTRCHSVHEQKGEFIPLPVSFSHK